MYMYMYIHIYIYIYICMYNLPPLIINPPKKKTNLWGDSCFTINLDRGTITPLISDDLCFDLPPS